MENVDVPRSKKPPTRYTGPALSTTATTLTEYFRPIYFALIDNATAKLDERFEKSAGLKRHGQLEKVLTTGEIDDDDKQLLNCYPWRDRTIFFDVRATNVPSQQKHTNRETSCVGVADDVA